MKKYGFVIVFVIGLLIFLFGAYQLGDSLYYKFQGKPASGEIVEMIRNYKHHRAKAKNVKYKARITYLFENRKHEFINSTNYGNQSSYYEVGNQVDLLVIDPETGQVKINSITELWLLPVAVIVIGGVFMWIGLRNPQPKKV